MVPSWVVIVLIVTNIVWIFLWVVQYLKARQAQEWEIRRMDGLFETLRRARDE